MNLNWGHSVLPLDKCCFFVYFVNQCRLEGATKKIYKDTRKHGEALSGKSSKYIVWNFFVFAQLSLSTSCQWNSSAEKEVITGWILAGNNLVKDTKRFLGYACTCTIIQYLNDIEPFNYKLNVWNKFLTIPWVLVPL